MAFKSYKFNMPSYSGSGCASQKDYCDMWLNNLVTAFTTANAAWSQVGTIETIGADYTGYGARTVQLQSSANNKYVRIWVFETSNYQNARVITTPAA